MKKTGKIKILEKGRLFGPEELNRIRGGCTTPYSTCSTGSTYQECTNGVWITCSETPSVKGYHNYGPDGSIICSAGYTYEHCHTMRASCGGNLYYENIPI